MRSLRVTALLVVTLILTGSTWLHGQSAGDLKFRFRESSVWRGNPAIGNDGTIYMGSDNHYAYALNSDGTLKWKYLTGNRITSSPAIGSDSTVYIGSWDGYLYALYPDGTLKWRYYAGAIDQSTPAIGSDGTLYLGSQDHYIYAINSNGTLRWKYQTGSTIFSSPAIGVDGTVYVGSDDTYLYALNPDGTLKWRFQIGGFFYSISAPAIGDDGTVYIGSQDSYLYALNADGSLKWRYHTGSYVRSSPAIGTDGTVYVGSNDNYLYALNADGSLNWRFHTNGVVESSPAIGADGTVYVGSQDNYLYALNADGSLKWQFLTDGYVYSSSPSMSADGIVYIGSYELYAVYSGTTTGLATSPWPKFHFNMLNTGSTQAFSPAPEIDVTPTALDFGPVPVDSTMQLTFTIANIGTADLVVDSITSSNSLFTLSQDTTTIAAGLSLIVTVSFSPTAADSHFATTLVSSNDEDEGLVSILLSGIGVGPSPPEAGDLIFKYQTGGSVESSPALGADGTIYVGSNDNNLYAINPDGTLKWEYLTGDVVRGSPAIGTDGTIYVGSYDNYLYALNPDGTLKWRYLTSDNVHSTPAIGVNGTIYVASFNYAAENNYFYALNSDGTLKWQYQTGGGVSASPAIGEDGTVYAGSKDHYLYAFRPDGTLKWKYLTGGIFYSSPAIGVDGTVFASSDDGYLYALNPDSTLKWRFQAGNAVNSSPAIGTDGTIYVGSNDLYLYAINQDGTLKWRYFTGYSVYSSPAVGEDGTIYFGSYSGNYIYALNTDGTLKWNYMTGSTVYSSPNISANGTIYLGANDSYLYALESGTGQGLADSAWPKFHYDRRNTGSIQVTLPAPQIIVVPDFLSFGIVPVDSSSQQTFSIYNIGNSELVVNNILSDNPVFTVDTTSITVAASDSVSIAVTFSPTEAGLASGTLTILSNDPDEDSLLIVVSGNETPAGIPYVEIDQELFDNYVAFGLDEAYFKERATVSEGNIGSNGAMTLGISSKITADVSAGSDLYLKESAVVNGDVVYGGTLTLGRNAIINGTITQVVPDTLNFSVSEFSAGEESITVVQNGNLNLDPGSYDQLWVRANGTLTLSSGSYFFNNLNIGLDVDIRLDLADGPLYVYIVNILEIHEHSTMQIVSAGGDATQVFFIILGNTASGSTSTSFIGIDTQFMGTVIAPASKLWIKERANVTGAFYAKNLTVGINTVMTFSGSSGSPLLAGASSLSSAAEAAALPKTFSLSQNSPNPFNPSTAISYNVPEGPLAAVSIKVYDLRGRLVRTLVDKAQAAGTYTVYWDGKDSSGLQLASGIYFYRLQAEGFSQIRKMILLK